MTFHEADHPRDRGQFTDKTQSAPEAVLADVTEPETLVWVVEGDDHEAVLVSATSVEAALEAATDSFSGQYDEEYDEDLLNVIGAFRGDIDDTDELVFVAIGSLTDERAARRALDHAN